MHAALDGNTDCAIVLLKAKANVNAKNNVWSRRLDVGVCAEVEHPLGLSALEPRWRCRGRVVASSAMPMPFRQSRRYRMGRMRCSMQKARITAILSQCSNRYWASVVVSDGV